MNITLSRSDLKPQFGNVPCELIRFHHLTTGVQQALQVVGQATFFEQDRSNYIVVTALREPCDFCHEREVDFDYRCGRSARLGLCVMCYTLPREVVHPALPEG